ncbi:TetR/AcrR family transcriptional regulator [Kineosporia sp. J2-2]|uniref:TetR/AcrR family transcriptional regulator n=1 Tax=Kineosporia corallincola TaxID=2835133 RepID=A0ABS5TLQ5_9ACTN|nr:TetR/AcrR family transcriptional regulator [Kineosporia corallincola]MBT0772035.1 TetR/AcrR family transcriptional regulator [Kineosporia corallincola]
MGGSTTGRRGPYAGTAARRRTILESAFEVFSEAGYRGGSMRDIAQRIGIAHTTLLHHFSSKSDLLAGVLELRDEHDQPGLAEAGGAGILRQLVEVVRRNQRTPGLTELYCILSAEATAPGHPAHEWFRERYVRTVGHTRAALEQMAQRGELREGVDPAREAQRIVALMDGLQVQWLLDRDSIDMAAQMREYLRRVSVPEI